MERVGGEMEREWTVITRCLKVLMNNKIDTVQRRKRLVDEQINRQIDGMMERVWTVIIRCLEVLIEQRDGPVHGKDRQMDR